MTELTYPQRSEEWFIARMGKITGSKLPGLMPAKTARTAFTKTQLSTLRDIATEILTGEYITTPTTRVMQWGIDHEDDARELASMLLNKNFRECGFYTDSNKFGSSPDGISDDSDLEIKCPTSSKHLSYLLDPQELIDDYKWQCYMHMFCTGKKLCYLFSYDPRFIDPNKQHVIAIIEWDDKEMKKLTTRLEECFELISEWVA